MDPMIFHENIKEYFSVVNSSINVDCLERRLGEQMMMLARTQNWYNGTVVVSSTRKWRDDEAGIRACISDSQAVAARDEVCDRMPH